MTGASRWCSGAGPFLGVGGANRFLKRLPTYQGLLKSSCQNLHRTRLLYTARVGKKNEGKTVVTDFASLFFSHFPTNVSHIPRNFLSAHAPNFPARMAAFPPVHPPASPARENQTIPKQSFRNLRKSNDHFFPQNGQVALPDGRMRT